MLAAVSPHLDDAVFGCGALLAASPGSVVITALAGGPPTWESLTPWDAACGFSPGEDAIAARRQEDGEALAILDSTPVWLDYPDAQYGGPPPPDELCAALGRALDSVSPHRACVSRDSALHTDTQSPEAVLVPLGLFHSDHRVVAEAAIALFLSRPGLPVHAYEEPSYRRIPGLVREALSRLRSRGIDSAPSELPATVGSIAPSCAERKRRAVRCYRSQLRGLCSPGRPGFDDVFEPERLWRLTA